MSNKRAQKKPPVNKPTFRDDSQKSSIPRKDTAGKEVTASQPLSGAVDDTQDLGLEVVNFQSTRDILGPLPRPQRKRRQAAEDQGLPPDVELEKFARFYLSYTSRLWPELAKLGLIPEATDVIVSEMIESYKIRHRTGKVDLVDLDAFRKHCDRLAALYPRYSDDSSQPKSIVDQARQQLDKAKSEGRFAPWCLVFADYERSALHGVRQGYTSLLKAIKNRDCRIETVYIDDFMRANRINIEWWKLAGLCKKISVRLVGASDGFHIDDEDWDMKVGFYNLITLMETKYKRQRVRRGMRGSANENKPLGKQPLGYTRRNVLDSAGHIILKSNGQPQTQRCIDPVSSVCALEMWKLFYEKKWTPYAIAKKFNRENADGWDGWNEKTIKELLVNPAYVGLFIWNRTRTEYNVEEQKWEVLPNHWTLWEWHYDPKLALIPKEQHVYARNKLVKSKNSRKRDPKARSRKAVSLFSGTLFCECGCEIKMWKSGKHPAMYCQNGNLHRHGCKTNSSKSVKIIEECVVGFIRNELLTEDRLRELVKRANKYLSTEMAKPLVNVSPLRQQISLLEKDKKKLFQRILQTDNELLRAAYDKEIVQHEQNISKLRKEIHEAEVSNRRPPAVLKLSRVKEYAADLREVLRQEIPAAAETIRELTGPITIRQEEYGDDRPGARWIAEFSPNFVGMLSQISRKRDYPDSMSLEYLRTGNWTRTETCTVAIDRVHKYERLAPEVKRLHDSGVSLQVIADANNLAWQQAKEILQFATTGDRPRRKKYPKKNRKNQGDGNLRVNYKAIALDVVRLKEKENWPFPKIQKWLEQRKFRVSIDTIRRAYNYSRPEIAKEATARETSRTPIRYSHLGRSKYIQIRRLIKKGWKDRRIAEKLGIGTSTVNRERQRLKTAAESPGEIPSSFSP